MKITVRRSISAHVYLKTITLERKKSIQCYDMTQTVCFLRQWSNDIFTTCNKLSSDNQKETVIVYDYVL
jgi:hypothetical protein